MKVRDIYLSEMMDKLTRLNRRASKLGQALLSITVGPAIHETHYENLVPRVKVFHEIILSGTAPTVEGYALVATSETIDGGNILNVVPSSTDDLTAYRTSAPNCDHCNTSRYRIWTYILRSPEGHLTRVGKQCLADYLRDPGAAQAIVEYFSYLDAVNAILDDAEGRESGGMGGGGDYTSITHILEMAVSCVREYGYVSRKAAEEQDRQATSEKVRAAMNPDSKFKLDITDADKAKALVILEYIKGIEASNDYEHNLKLLASGEIVRDRQLGYVVSMVAYFDRAMEALEEKRVSNFVGEVGVKGTWTLTVRRVIVLENNFGRQLTYDNLFKMTDAQGNLFIWKTGTMDMEPGTQLRLTAKMFAHEEYRGEKQNIVKRCKVEILS